MWVIPSPVQRSKMAVIVSACLLSFLLSETTAQVIIRQYIEGNAFNKVIQLENVGSQEAV